MPFFEGYSFGPSIEEECATPAATLQNFFLYYYTIRLKDGELISHSHFYVHDTFRRRRILPNKLIILSLYPANNLIRSLNNNMKAILITPFDRSAGVQSNSRRASS